MPIQPVPTSEPHATLAQLLSRTSDLEAALAAQTERAEGLEAALAAQTERAEHLEATLAAQAERAQRLEAALASQTERSNDLRRGEARRAAVVGIPEARESALALLDTIFETAPIGLAFFDTDLRFIRINARLAEINGLSQEAHLGHSLGEILPQIVPLVEPIVRQVLATGVAVCDQEIHGTTPADEDDPRDWLASYYPVPCPTGGLTGVGVVLSEITARKRAELALRTSEANLRAILASTAQAYILLDSDLRLVLWNSMAEAGMTAYVGLPLRVGARITDYVPPGIAPERIALMDRVLQGERICSEVDVSTPAKPRWLAVEYSPVCDADGQIRGLCISTLDVTERHQVEAELRASEVRFRLLAEHAQDLIYRYQLAPIPGFEYVSPSATAITGYTPEEHYADPQLGLKLVHPDDQHLFQAALADPATVDRPLTLRWWRKDGRVIWTEQVNRVIVDALGHPVVIEGIARDITARQEAEERVRAALAAEQQSREVAERAAARITRLQAVTAALAATLTLDEVVQVVLDLGCSATGAFVGVLRLINGAEDQLEVVQSSQLPAVLATFLTIPLDSPLPSAQVARTQTAVWIGSREDGAARFPGFGPMLNRCGIAAYAAVPLVAAGRSIGVLSLGFSTPQPFPDEDCTLLMAVAQQCAQSIVRARLYAEVQASHTRLQHLSQRLIEAQEQERRHLARELHDEVGQTLTGLRLSLELLGRMPPEERPARLAAAHYATQELIARVRALSLDLRPAMLDDMGLLPALLWQVRRYTEQTGITVDLRHWGLERRFPPAVATVAYRIVQEALTNVARSAGVQSAAVSLLASPTQLIVQVRDSGRGFVLAEALAGGQSSGLTGMQERVSLLGGTLSIETAPGTGTCLTADLPLGEEFRP